MLNLLHSDLWTSSMLNLGVCILSNSTSCICPYAHSLAHTAGSDCCASFDFSSISFISASSLSHLATWVISHLGALTRLFSFSVDYCCHSPVLTYVDSISIHSILVFQSLHIHIEWSFAPSTLHRHLPLTPFHQFILYTVTSPNNPKNLYKLVSNQVSQSLFISFIWVTL